MCRFLCAKFLTSPSELLGTGRLGMDTLASVTSCITSAGSSGSSYSKCSRFCLSSDTCPDEVGVPAMPELDEKHSRSDQGTNNVSTEASPRKVGSAIFLFG